MPLRLEIGLPGRLRFPDTPKSTVGLNGATKAWPSHRYGLPPATTWNRTNAPACCCGFGRRNVNQKTLGQPAEATIIGERSDMEIVLMLFGVVVVLG